MRFHNHSHLPTGVLRAIVAGAIAHRHASSVVRNVTVETARYTRRGVLGGGTDLSDLSRVEIDQLGLDGRCDPEVGDIWLWVPRRWRKVSPQRARWLAQIALHEVDHALSPALDNRHMEPWWNLATPFLAGIGHLG